MALSNERGFEILLTKVQKELGFSGTQYKEKCLKRRFNSRMRRLDIEDDFWAYIKYLDQHPEEYEFLRKNLTINVTKFFRNWPVFSFLHETIISELLSQAAQSKGSVRIWSAGCASGEEPYSLAILVNEQKKNCLNRYRSPFWQPILMPIV